MPITPSLVRTLLPRFDTLLMTIGPLSLVRTLLPRFDTLLMTIELRLLER